MAPVVAFVALYAAEIAAVTAVVGAGVAYEGNRRAKSAAKDLQQSADDQALEARKQRGIVNKRAEITANRARRERARRFRILRGSQQNEAANAGTASSSGASGAQGSLASQFASQEGTAGGQLIGDAAVAASREKEALAVGRGTAAQIAGMKAQSLQQMGGALFNIGGGAGSVADIFTSGGGGGTTVL